MVERPVGRDIYYIMKEKLVKTMLDLRGKVIIITDVTEAWSQKFAESVSLSGASLYILGDNQKKLDDVIKKINKKGGNSISGFYVDLTDLDQVVAIKEEVVNTEEKIDILINNYIMKKEDLPTDKYFNDPENYPIELWQRFIDYNINSVFLSSQQFGSVMARNGGGGILNVVPSESVRGMNYLMYDGNIPPLHYPVAKACIINFTRYLATYWAQKNIRVNCLVMGGIKDEVFENQKINIGHIPLNKYASDSEFTGALIYMISDASTYMTGSIVTVDGGITCY